MWMLNLVVKHFALGRPMTDKESAGTSAIVVESRNVSRAVGRARINARGLAACS